tara:strand:- start:24 stop:203 length:180 start_codon:yes stop_codon:yes gene_type:complete
MEKTRVLREFMNVKGMVLPGFEEDIFRDFGERPFESDLSEYLMAFLISDRNYFFIQKKC